MTVASICNSFINTIQKNYSLSMFSNGSGEDNTLTASALAALKEIPAAISSAQTSIDTGFKFLFDDLEQSTGGEHQNFLVLNSLSEVFRNTPSYSFSTREYTDKLDYSYTCGQIYTSYAKGCTGDFISNLFGYVPVDVNKICSSYQTLYTKFTPTTTSTSDTQTNTKGKGYQFWSKYLNSFKSDLSPLKTVFNSLASDFNWLYDEIKYYKEIGINAAKIQATGFVFTTTDSRTELTQPTMSDVFSTCKTKFKIYDTLIEELYELWLNTQDHITTYYPDLEEYQINSERTKMYSGILLEHVNFYSSATTIYNDLLTFFKKYAIN